MASLTINTKVNQQSSLINVSSTTGLIICCTHHSTNCQPTKCFSILKHNLNAKNEIDDHINEFQQNLWTKHGQTMSTNWIDPFEIYD